MSGAPEKPPEPVRVQVAERAHVYTAPGSHPWRGGDEIELPADHAAVLAESKHVAEAKPAEPKPEAPAAHE